MDALVSELERSLAGTKEQGSRELFPNRSVQSGSVGSLPANRTRNTWRLGQRNSSSRMVANVSSIQTATVWQFGALVRKLELRNAASDPGCTWMTSCDVKPYAGASSDNAASP